MMKKILANLWSFMCITYVLSAIIAIPYFNWQYARDHGFFKWMFLGEIVPTAKGFVWPYFVFMSRPKPSIGVVPGKSIAGVELGMSRDKVISVLGKPTKEISSSDIGQIGQFGVLGGGTFKGRIPQMTVFVYSIPPLFVSLHEDDKVGAIQLSYTESVRVEGYDFLKFKYLTKEEIERLGKSPSIVRDEDSEQRMLSRAPRD
jgi:hypothetical protein